MADSHWYSFWFAYGENPCLVTAVGSDTHAVAIEAATQAYHWLSDRHGRFPLGELRLVQGTREPLYAQNI